MPLISLSMKACDHANYSHFRTRTPRKYQRVRLLVKKVFCLNAFESICRACHPSAPRFFFSFSFSSVSLKIRDNNATRRRRNVAIPINVAAAARFAVKTCARLRATASIADSTTIAVGTSAVLPGVEKRARDRDATDTNTAANRSSAARESAEIPAWVAGAIQDTCLYALVATTTRTYGCNVAAVTAACRAKGICAGGTPTVVDGERV